MSRKVLYSVLSVGVIATFFGHGAWAVGAKDSFVALLTGSVDNVLGATMSTSTGESIVRVIGVADIALAAAMALMLVGALRGAGALYRFAYSNIAVGVYAWAVVWGFVTAFARMTAVGEFFPEVWDWVERAPNWMLPAALIYLIVKTRNTHPEAPLFVPETLKGTAEPETVG